MHPVLLASNQAFPCQKGGPKPDLHPRPPHLHHNVRNIIANTPGKLLAPEGSFWKSLFWQGFPPCPPGRPWHKLSVQSCSVRSSLRSSILRSGWELWGKKSHRDCSPDFEASKIGILHDSRICFAHVLRCKLFVLALSGAHKYTRNASAHTHTCSHRPSPRLTRRQRRKKGRQPSASSSSSSNSSSSSSSSKQMQLPTAEKAQGCVFVRTCACLCTCACVCSRFVRQGKQLSRALC